MGLVLKKIYIQIVTVVISFHHCFLQEKKKLHQHSILLHEEKNDSLLQ